MTAYYYMAMMIAGLLFVIPNATAQSLFAEGSHNEKNLNKQVWKAIKIISIILIPAILVVVFFGNYILMAFGEEYVVEGFGLLRVLAVSGIFVSINSIFAGVAKINKKVWKIGFVNLIGVPAVLGGVYFSLSQDLDLIGIGYAYIFGQLIMNCLYGFLKIIKK